MTPSEREARLCAQLLLIEDPLERLAFIQDRARKIAPLPDWFRTDAFRVSGCVTRVWLRCDSQAGRCRFEVDSESNMVRGLALLIAEIYSDCAAADIVAFSSSLSDRLGLARAVSPTRLHGLARIEAKIRRYAQTPLAANLPPAPPETSS